MMTFTSTYKGSFSLDGENENLGKVVNKWSYQISTNAYKYKVPSRRGLVIELVILCKWRSPFPLMHLSMVAATRESLHTEQTLMT